MADSSRAGDPSAGDVPVDTRSVSEESDSSNEEGWEDVEPDEESQPVMSLFSEQVFPDVRSMLKDSKENYDFDLLKIQKDLGLDFLDTIKLVNYVRSQVKAGNKYPDVSSKSKFEDDAYLKPVLEDDALLYSLDDIAEDAQDAAPGSEAERKVIELQEELERLQSQFSEYRIAVQKSLEDQLSKEDETLGLNGTTSSEEIAANRASEIDADYFASYAYNGIHESMLKDTIRTDAYRDFVYENKHVFKDKVVLDVGCGTGILSMFCAKAGAKKVISVDNSNIIDRAREIVYDNGLGDVITCIRGKIEEVELPVDQVDIIISEWMGYGLLFEAMFDSVIYARDRYLAPNGLMVPSHATLRIAPYADPDFIASHISFWENVYGFKMNSMLLKIYDEAVVRGIHPNTIVGDSTVFLPLPLHTITVEELTFLKNFQVTLKEDIDALDGWAIWFDIFFMPSRDSDVPEDAIPSDMQKKGYVAFTTGPDGTETHWQQVVALIDYDKKKPCPLKKGDVIKGTIGYRKRSKESRGLDINIQWEGENTKGNQKWGLQ
ncbi:S-adenosylmethionine-dependent methyltransferase superfamily domain-containing protein [Penicillium chermesinum]|uniref:type I protein arginine methyltransferase n=1 Tax=Penicillium chermesinum TaxID=63820 RepID=A0A9W9TT30_9EURO|nr:S-adenosylmethionine-dependent methyltransferase superfamily domain-containing protein [Penicillium chermesinum]KAJ5239708.1 S-adenosylmethionine-dependent methyltransferase superfamily domain-containing protein [Penicillium chermesinum]KAJ6166592.1 S-adenosylmethionine-dependent methyltransferase superfamily domain-containing protein [Penicillium chermesinum]